MADVFGGRAAVGYDCGCDGEVFYLSWTLGPANVKGFVEGSLGRVGEDDQNEEDFLRGAWEDGDDRGFVLETLKSGAEVRPSKPPD